MKLKVIVPITTTKFNDEIRQEVEAVLAPDATYDLVNISHGTDSIESRYAEFLDTKDIIDLSLQAQSDGFDAIFVDCFGEPGVETVRELVDIPVVGGFIPSILMAKAVAQQYSIVTVMPSVVPMLIDLERKANLGSEIVSNRVVNIPVEQLGDRKRLFAALLEQSLLAIAQGAQAIVLGCTGMLGVATDLQAELVKMQKPAPVIDPTKSAISLLEALVRTKLSHSRLTYYPVSPLTQTLATNR